LSSVTVSRRSLRELYIKYSEEKIMDYGNKIREITELNIMDIRKAFYFIKDGFNNIKSRFEEAEEYEKEFKFYIDSLSKDPSILKEKTPRGDRFRDAKEKLFIVSSMFKFAFDQQEIAYRMAHVFIISIYEASIKQLFKVVFDVDQSLFVEDSIDKIVNVDNLHSFMIRKFEVDISDFSEWGDFKEAFYRRHVIVHKHGTYDEKYQKKVGCHASIIETKVKTDFDYIEKLYKNTIGFIGYLQKLILTRFGWGVVGRGTNIEEILDTIKKKGA